MNKTLFVVAILLLTLAIALNSCSTLKGITGCGKTLPVVFITKSGYTYTLNVPFCDTIRLETDNVPDSVKVAIIGQKAGRVTDVKIKE